MSKYQEKIQREKDFYQHREGETVHFLNSRVFYAPERTAFSVKFCKMQFAKQIREVLDRDRLVNPNLLIAPVGVGNDLPYLLPLSQRITGIDISEFAIETLSENSITKHVGDIKHMSMFEDGQFDVIVMSAFFHHFVKFGFDDFLKEARRVLRKGGYFFSFEPSILHPFAAVAWCAKNVFGNFTGCVKDESPFFPGRLTTAMRRCGFQDVRLSAASYSHQRMPIPFARIIHATTVPLLRAPLLRYFGWGCVFFGRKH